MTKIGVDAHTPLVATTLRDDKKSRVRVDLENLEIWAKSLDPDTEVVLEASTNAFCIQGALMPHVKRVAVAYPLHLRWIAESRMKTGRPAAQGGPRQLRRLPARQALAAVIWPP